MIRDNFCIDRGSSDNVIEEKVWFIVTIRPVCMSWYSHKVGKISFFTNKNKTFAVVCDYKIKCLQIIFEEEVSAFLNVFDIHKRISSPL